MTSTKVFVSGRAIAWSGIKALTHFGPADVHGPGIGLLSIFRTEEDAQTEFPGAPVFEIYVPDTWLASADPTRPPSRGDT